MKNEDRLEKLEKEIFVIKKILYDYLLKEKSEKSEFEKMIDRFRLDFPSFSKKEKSKEQEDE
jgi:hypothetical protein